MPSLFKDLGPISNKPCLIYGQSIAIITELRGDILIIRGLILGFLSSLLCSGVVYAGSDSLYSQQNQPAIFSPAEEAVIKTHDEAVTWLEAMNVAQLKALRACLCKVKGLSQCDQSQAEFNHNFISARGDYKTKIESCEIAVDKYLTGRLPGEISQMRQELALSDAETDTGKTEAFIKGELTVPEMMKVNLSHPFTMALFDQQISPLTNNEKDAAAKTFNDQRDLICSQFIIDNRNLIEKFFGDSKQIGCRELMGIPDKRVNYDQAIIGSKIYRTFLTYVQIQWPEYRSRHLSKYFEAVNNDPSIVFFKSSEPTASEIYDAISQVHDRAVARAREPHTYSELWFYKERWALPYTRALLKKRYPNVNYQDTIISLFKKGQNAEAFIDYTKAGISIGVFTGCNFIPAGRALKLVSLAVSRNICRLIVGVTADSYFVIDGIISYHDLMGQFLSAIESTQNSVSIEDLLSEQTQTWLAIELLPLSPLLSR